MNPTRSQPKYHRLIAILMALVVIAAACGSTEESSTDAVNFRWDTFDGSTKALSDLPEGPVVLNFFASWCPPCIAEMPAFEEVSQAMGTEVRFIGLAMQDRPENALRIVEDTGVTYEIGQDPNGDVMRQMGGLAMPTTVFIDANRVVQRVHSGALTAEALSDMITEELLS